MYKGRGITKSEDAFKYTHYVKSEKPRRIFYDISEMDEHILEKGATVVPSWKTKLIVVEKLSVR
jgi:hypothetical protein